MKLIRILCLLLFAMPGCGKFSALNGKLGSSQSIVESKKRKVFLYEYKLSSNIFEFNDTIKVHIENAWLEKNWRFDYPYDNTLIGDGYQIILVLKKGNWKRNYKKNWYLGTDYSFNFTPIGDGKLISNVFKVEPLNYLKIKIQKEDKLSNNQNKEILGELKFVKK